MRKFLAMFVTVSMLFALGVSPSFAAVGIKVGNDLKGTATDIKFGSNTGGQITNDGSTWTFNLLLAGIGNGGATSMASSDLAVPVTHGYVGKSIASDAAFGAGTLANGVPGQMLTIYIYQDLGSVDFVVTPATSTTVKSFTFDSVGDLATLLYIDDTVGWVSFSTTSVTITAP